MVLRDGHGAKGCTVRKNEERCFLAGHEFFNDKPRTSSTHGTNFHEIVNGGTRLFESLCDNHTLTGCKAVGLDHDWQASVLQPAVCLLSRAALPKGGGRNPVSLEESLRVSLAGFQLGIRSVGADNLQTSLTKHIDDAKAERHFRPDKCQIHLL